VPWALTGVVNVKAMTAAAEASAMRALRMFLSFIDMSRFQY